MIDPVTTWQKRGVGGNYMEGAIIKDDSNTGHTQAIRPDDRALSRLRRRVGRGGTPARRHAHLQGVRAALRDRTAGSGREHSESGARQYLTGLLRSGSDRPLSRAGDYATEVFIESGRTWTILPGSQSDEVESLATANISPFSLMRCTTLMMLTVPTPARVCSAV